MSASRGDGDLDTEDLVELATDCFDAEDGSTKITDTRTWDWVMPPLLENLERRLREYNISTGNIRSNLRDFLSEIKDEDKPGQYFEDNFEDFEREIQNIPESAYTVAFPLNYSYKPGRKQDQYSALGYEIERWSKANWLSEYKEPAEKAEKQKHQGHGDDPFTSFMSEVPNEFGYDQTYWTIEIRARDEKFAVDRLELVLEYLLGKINYCAHVGKTQGFSTSSSVWQEGWSDLKLPFIYLIFDEDSYIRFFHSEDISPRDGFSVHSSHRSRYDVEFDRFPELRYPLDDLEEKLVQAVRHLQSGITESSKEESFFDYWRGIEALTLTDEDDDMNTVIQRASSHLQPENPPLFQFRLTRAREKRNRLVHEGIDIPVSKEDQNLAKLVLDHLIGLYSDRLDEWGREEFSFYLDNVSIETGLLKQKRETLAQETDILEEIIESQEYEPGPLEKILIDWSGRKNELEDKDFLDPFGFHFPVYGVGSTDTDVMVVFRSPEYPMGEDQEPLTKRTRIPGPRPSTTVWTVEDIREVNTGLVQNGYPQGGWKAIEAVASATGFDPEDVYFTTLQKDGQFDESLDTIGEDLAPEVLNQQSIDTWEQYLRLEIETVDPDLILAFGEETASAIVDELSVIEDESVSDVSRNEVYVVDRYPVIRFRSWDSIEDEEMGKKEFVATILSEEDW